MQILAPTVLVMSFAAVQQRQSQPIFAPEGTEVTTVIAAVNGIVQGATSVDYTNSGAAAVAAGTATWVTGALVYNAAGTYVQKVYQDCYVRVNCTAGTAYTKIDPAGNSITPANNPFDPYINSGVIPPPAPPEIVTGVIGDASTNNSPTWAAALAEGGSFVSTTIRARFALDGVYNFNALNDLYPSLSIPMDARGGIIMQAAAAMPATTSAPGAGAPGALVRILARTPPNPSVQAWETEFGGFNMQGQINLQTAINHGIRKPNPNPANNTFDPDPSYSTNKDYTAGYFYNQDVVAFSGSALVIEAGNGRLSLMNWRGLNCGNHGIDAGGNDIVIYGHSAAGGNGSDPLGQLTGGFGLKTGLVSGAHITTPNFWGSAGIRQLKVGAYWNNTTKLTSFFGGELNDWGRIDSDNNPAFGGSTGKAFWRGGSYVGIQLAPFNEIFLSDGVAQDVTVGGADDRLQAQWGISSGQNFHFIGNQFSRTTSTNITESGFPQFPFATPYNTGGDLLGNFGTAFQYRYRLINGAMVNIIDTVNSAPNVKAWVNTNPALPSYQDPVAIKVSGSQANYIEMDSFLNQVRIGGRGNGQGGGSPIHSHVMLACNEAAFGNTAYVVEIGDSTQPGGVPFRSAHYGMNEFINGAVQYGDAAYDSRNTVSGLARVVKAGQVYQHLITAGGGILAYTLTLPTDMNASYELAVLYQGGAIAALTTNVAGGGSISSAGLQPATSSPGWMVQQWEYRHDSNSWYLKSQLADGGMPMGRLDTNAAAAGVVGEVLRITVAANAAFGISNATPTNVLGPLALPNGSWLVFGTVGFVGATATVSSIQCAISSTTGTLPAAASQDNRYAAEDFVSFAGVTGTFITKSLGPMVLHTASNNIFLVAQANFSVGAVSVYGDLVAVRFN